ncbi:MAG TPA: alcohol dehydrogenase catalytic domain-containing protein [Thermoanaerobaculia bacterium]|nr:alcohol dehydrogenase catalytic domain-containing protein [Thermoanaerobaculia bacterium]
MRAFVQTGIGAFEERDIPAPRAGRGEVVLRVLAALTCGTDVKLLARGHPKIALPVTMGHEACGEVVEVGEGVRDFGVGDRVVPGISGPCGKCRECRAGMSNLCVTAHGDRTWGAFAEFLRVPAGVVAANLHAVPAWLPDETAAFLDPLASVLHGWDRLSPTEGKLLVYGAGALGLLWAATARARGVPSIVAARGGAARLAIARAYGADVLDLEREGAESLAERAPAMAVDCTGDPDVWSRLPDLVAPGGKVLLFGGCAPGTTVAWEAERLHYSEISLVGSFHSTPANAREALRMLAAGEIDPSPLVAGQGTLADLPRFLAAQAARQGIRYAVRPSPRSVKEARSDFVGT